MNPLLHYDVFYWWYICVVQQCVHSGFVHGHGVCTYAVSYIGVRWSCPPGRVPQQRQWQRRWQAWSYDVVVTTSITPTSALELHDTVCMMWYHKKYLKNTKYLVRYESYMNRTRSSWATYRACVCSVFVASAFASSIVPLLHYAMNHLRASPSRSLWPQSLHLSMISLYIIIVG